MIKVDDIKKDFPIFERKINGNKLTYLDSGATSQKPNQVIDVMSDVYKNNLLPQRGALKVTFEAGISRGWEKYHGPNGLSISIDHYGLSAPYGDLAEEFGFTCEKVEMKIREHLKKLL